MKAPASGAGAIVWLDRPEGHPSQTAPAAQVPPPVYRLTLRPEPHVARPILALRAFLKAALRSYGLRCIEAVELGEDER